MTSEDDSQQEPPGGPAPWWIAAAGGGGGITAAVLQDHALAWAALSAFALWLAYSLAIAWLAGSGTRGRRNPGRPSGGGESRARPAGAPGPRRQHARRRRWRH